MSIRHPLDRNPGEGILEEEYKCAQCGTKQTHRYTHPVCHECGNMNLSKI